MFLVAQILTKNKKKIGDFENIENHESTTWVVLNLVFSTTILVPPEWNFGKIWEFRY